MKVHFALHSSSQVHQDDILHKARIFPEATLGRLHGLRYEKETDVSDGFQPKYHIFCAVGQ